MTYGDRDECDGCKAAYMTADECGISHECSENVCIYDTANPATVPPGSGCIVSSSPLSDAPGGVGTSHKCDLGVECWAAPAHSHDCCTFDPRSCHPNNDADREEQANRDRDDAARPQDDYRFGDSLDSRPSELEEAL